MPSRSIIRTGVGPHREPRNRFPAMAAAINLLAARAARVQSRRNLNRSLSPKLDHSHSITRFDRSRTGPKTFTRSAATIAMALLAAGGTTPARSQTVAELFSYKAPSGMFFEGTAKAEHYRFFYEDEERMANRRAGRGFVLSTPPSAEGRQAAHLRAGDRTPRWTNLSRP